jgi:exodeoxyribonuclease VII large subunit
MIVEQIEDAGEGELQRRFEALKKSLAAEGLFDDAHKQDIPAMPYRIGIVTSPSGAAVRDVLTVLKRRFPAIPVMIYPAAVQGVAAIAQLTAALETATDRNECDVIIVTRGGGSLEDLWAFNEEAVARAIHACPIPVISAVGHEIDFTIADFVADVRAPTPSGAAEIVVPDQAEWLRALEAAATRVESLARRHLEDRYQRVDWLSKRLSQSSPGATVARQMAWLKNLQQLLNAATRHGLSVKGRQLDAAKARLLWNSPAIEVQRSMSRLGSARHNLIAAGMAALQRRKAQLKLAERSLIAVSPLATLERGYAIVVEEASGKILRDSVDVVAGSNICARLAKGTLKATVTETIDSADG